MICWDKFYNLQTLTKFQTVQILMFFWMKFLVYKIYMDPAEALMSFGKASLTIYFMVNPMAVLIVRPTTQLTAMIHSITHQPLFQFRMNQVTHSKVSMIHLTVCSTASPTVLTRAKQTVLLTASLTVQWIISVVHHMSIQPRVCSRASQAVHIKANPTAPPSASLTVQWIILIVHHMSIQPRVCSRASQAVHIKAKPTAPPSASLTVQWIILIVHHMLLPRVCSRASPLSPATHIKAKPTALRSASLTAQSIVILIVHLIPQPRVCSRASPVHFTVHPLVQWIVISVTLQSVHPTAQDLYQQVRLVQICTALMRELEARVTWVNVMMVSNTLLLSHCFLSIKPQSRQYSRWDLDILRVAFYSKKNKKTLPSCNRPSHSFLQLLTGSR